MEAAVVKCHRDLQLPSCRMLCRIRERRRRSPFSEEPCAGKETYCYLSLTLTPRLGWLMLVDALCVGGFLTSGAELYTSAMTATPVLLATLFILTLNTTSVDDMRESYFSYGCASCRIARS
eukprot:752040-Hanusia_phi.AAC.7